MMKFALPFLMLMSFGLSAEISAHPTPNEVAPAPAPLLGSWVLDTSQMPVPAQFRPRSVTISFADVGSGQWTTRVLIIGADARTRDMIATYARDGVAVPIQGDMLEADAVAVATPTPNILVMALAKDRHPASTRVYSVSEDGETMTEEAVTTNDAGMPVIRVNHFSRLHS